MSWNSYIDNLIGQSGDNTDYACIIGLDGGASWTTSDNEKNLTIQPQEAAKIAHAMKANDYTTFQANGVHVNDLKYQFLRHEDNTIMAKRKEHGALTLTKSKTAIVIGHTAEGKQQGNTNKAVQGIAEYLESLGM